MSILVLIIVLASIAAVVFLLVKMQRPQEPQNEQPSEYAMLDENGNPMSIGSWFLELNYFCVKSTDVGISVWPKNQNLGTCIEFSLAGMTYRDNIYEYRGEHVGTLQAEPLNEYDPNAIKVLAEDGHHVGYVPRDQTEAIHKCCQLPCRCFFYIGTTEEDDGTVYYSDAYVEV